MSKKQVYNPYLPSWEYIPDGEPHEFNGRVYVYGSHDYFDGYVFCMGDYVCWSAPAEDLTDWRYEGVIYKKTDDPLNPDAKMCLYAPDVTQGPDGRYYLYYVLDKVSVVSVAVCDTPAGKYEFYGYVHDEDGVRLGDRRQDEPQFDPAVLTEGDTTYLYTGFCSRGDKSRHGAMVTTLSSDMLTMTREPSFVVPSCEYSQGTGFEEHEFFEASSIRKINNIYYFVYSSIVMHELCYATSDNPLNGFTYGGVIVSNCDMHIDSYKPADLPMCYGANNHGGILAIESGLYIFYHRHTNGSWYSRQGCAEPITILPDGSIPQVEITSCGLNGGPLKGRGYHPAYIACNLFTKHPCAYIDGAANSLKIREDSFDGETSSAYICNMTDSATAGFKYFECQGLTTISLFVRGYANGHFEIKTSWNGQVLASLPVENTNVWEEYKSDIHIPDGTHSIYITFCGDGNPSLRGFELT